MRKRKIIISALCLLLALPSAGLAETSQAQPPQSVKVETEKQVNAEVKSTSIAALVDDFTAPTLVSSTVDKTSVGVGESISITAQVTDDLSEVARVEAVFVHDDGWKHLPLTLDTETKEWKGTYTIQEYDRAGTWTIEFDMYDDLGNYDYAVGPDVEVVNPTGGDTEFPTLVSASATPLDVVANQEITIKAAVNDNVEVGTVRAAIYNFDSAATYYVPLTLNPDTNEWEGSFSFKEEDLAGSWIVDIDMFDTAGNFNYMNLPDLVLSNPLSDGEGPSIGNPVFSQTSASPGDKIQITVPVEDDQTGVSSVIARVFHTDSPDEAHTEAFGTPGATAGEWVIDLDIDSSFLSGAWNVIIYASDIAGNNEFKEILGAFDVANEDVDITPPDISNVVVTPQGEVHVGDNVTVTAKVSDNVGVDSVNAVFYSQVAYDSIPMSYDEANDQWVGSLPIQETTAPGFYRVSINAVDEGFTNGWADAAGGFTVVNPDGDYKGPVISDVQLDKTEVNAGESVTISASVEDVDSEVASVIVNYHESETIELTYDSDQSKWVGTITVPMNFPDGEVVKINFIDALDGTGNQTVQFIEATSFLVHNPNGDYTAPVVESFKMTPTFVKPGGTLHFEAKLLDDKSGIKLATVYLYKDFSPDITSIDLTYDEANQVWSGDYVIPAIAELGSYSVSLDVEDNAGNWDVTAFSQKLVITDDATPPEVPVVAEVTDQSVEVSGTTEAGATVTITIGEESYTGTADETGAFKVTIPVQNVGTEVTVSVTDKAGNISETVTVIVKDVTAPSVPTVETVTDQSEEVSGTTEGGATVTITIGSESYTGTADETGAYKVSIPVQKAGTVITVSAKDAFGNISEEASVTVVDKTPPAAPTVNTVTDKTTVITGTTEKNTTTTATIGDTTYTGTTYTNGIYKITIPRQVAGTVIAVTAADAAGNVSAESTITVGDATAPSVPKVNYVSNNATLVTGETEGGATVTVTIGTETYTGRAFSNGIFRVTIPLQEVGTLISVRVTDEAGNISNERTVTVIDKTRPSVPGVYYVSDKATEVTGKTEPGAFVTVYIGTETYSAIADSSGAYIVPIPIQEVGTLISVRATDAAGNMSNLRKVIVVDKTAPSAPRVNEISSLVTLVTGETEGGAYITVIIGNETYSSRAFSNGTFRVIIPQQKVGTLINVRSTDAAGNKSPFSKVLVVE